MRNLLSAVLFLSVAISATVAQTPEEEMTALRSLLGVPRSTVIRPADANRLANVPEIKVFVATGLDLGVRNNYYRWIEGWNDDNGKKYGFLKVVNDIEDANTVLARYTVKDSGSWRMTDPRADTRLIPVFAYIINRQDDNLEIAWRYAMQNATYIETRNSGKVLWDDFAKMLKARGKRKR